MLNKIQSLNALRTFEVCARVGSVQEAAKILHVTPSAVSHQLRKLEKELGFDLFIRTHRKITPTDKGHELQTAVSKSLGIISETIEALSDDSQTELVINVLPIFAIRWLNPRLTSFFKKHPEIDLTIKNSYRVEDLNHQKSDLAIRWGSGEWPGVLCEKLFDEYALPALSPELFDSANISTQEELLTLPLIQIFEGANHWELWARSNGFEIKQKLRYIKFNDPTAALQAAVDGIGVILGPLSLIDNDLSNSSLVTPFGKPIYTNNAYYLATPENSSSKNCNLIKFQEWIREEAKAFENTLVEKYKLY